MTNSLTAAVRCEDGTEIPFEWVYEDAEKEEWLRDRSHWPLPLTPMDLWLRQNRLEGADRAWSELGMEANEIFHRFQWVGPFIYARMSPYPPERIAPIAARYREVAREFGNTLGFWERYCEPRIKRICDDVANAPLEMPLAEVADLSGYGFYQTFTSAALLREASLRLGMLLGPVFGEEAMMVMFEVTQGGDNASQAIDREIEELATLARATPAVVKTLGAGVNDETLASLRREPFAAAFVAAFDALIARHGARSLGWEVSLPTWAERPEAPLALIAAQTASHGVSADEAASRSAEIRRRATERVLERLPAAQHDEFRAIVAELHGYVSIREGRAYWQMTITGQTRGLLLRRGAHLVGRGRIDRAEDVLFLLPDDLAGDGDLRGLVRERRTEHDRWCALSPPPIIGTPITAMPPPSTATELRGAPASRGQVTGTARILRSPEEGARLQRGDILVCVMTSPAWTPLFAIAGGIVTETGGPLSHPAITAREYGIPAVLAVKDATKLIADGQTVTIDGGAGVVSLSG